MSNSEKVGNGSGEQLPICLAGLWRGQLGTSGQVHGRPQIPQSVD